MTLKLDFNRKDEIGMLAKSFEKMVENLKYKSAILEKIAEGDLTTKTEGSSDNDVLAFSINSIIDSFSSVVEQADAVASGNFRDDMVLRSDKDQLGISMSNMLESLREVVDVAGKIASGDFNTSLKPKSDKDELSIAVNKMTRFLRELSQSRDEQNWLKTGQAELGNLLQGERSVDETAQETLRFITKYIKGDVGCIYTAVGNKFRIAGSYAMTYRKKFQN